MSWLKIIGKLNSKKVGIGLVRWGNLHTLAYGGIRKVSRKGLALLTAILLVLQMIYLPFPFSSPKKAYATPGSWSQTTFTGSDGTYTSTQPANSNQDATLDNFSALSNAGGGKWLYRKPVTITGSTAGAQTNYQVAVDPSIYDNTGLVGSWHFSEGSGTTTQDMSGNNNNGTITGATWTTAGKFGQGLSFDGVDDYVNIAAKDSLSNIDTITVEAWIKTTAGGSVVSNRYNVSGNGTWYTLYSNWIEIGDNVGGYASNPFNTTTNNNQWHHIVYRKSGTTHSIYVDGALDQSFTASGDISQLAPIYIGWKWNVNSDSRYAGLIDEVKIYNRALLATEITERYNSGSPKVRHDYADIRFTNSSGTELSYWQETDAKFWVKVDNIPTTGTTLYEYYGNPSATSASNDTTTFIDIYDAVADFSSIQGQRNWYYQEWNGSSYNNMTWDATNNNWKGTSTFALIWGGGAHPHANSAYDVARRWLSNGSYGLIITGNVRKSDISGGNGVIFRIYKNTTQLWSQTVAYNDNVGYNYSLSTTVANGDSIYFRLNNNGTDGYDSTASQPLKIRIRKYASPEPTAGTPGAETAAYVSSGTLVSQTINPAGMYDWGTLVFTKTTPASTTLTVDVLRASDSAVLATNVTSGTDLNTAGVSNSETSIKLRANFSGDGSNTPTLSDWTVNYDYDTTLPTDPSGLSASPASTTQINLSWTASTDTGGSGLAGYKIEQAPDSGGSPGTFSQIGTSALTSYNDTTGLTTNTKYWYRVRAYDNAGNNSGYTGLGNYFYKKTITFDTTAAGANVATNQTNFPVAVHINSSSWINATERARFFDASNVNGKRIKFYDSDETTVLDYEVEYYTAPSQEALYWVKVPQVDGNSNTDKIVVAYGNDPNGSDQNNPTGVWSNGFKAVYHLGDNSWGSGVSAAIDSTGNYTSASMSNVTGNVTGQVRNGASFSGTNSWYTANNLYSDVFSNNPTNSWSLWFKPTDMATNRLFWSEGKGTGTDAYFYLYTNGQVYGYTTGQASVTGAVSSGSFQHIFVNQSASNSGFIYVNGTDKTASNPSGLWATAAATKLNISSYRDASGNPGNGYNLYGVMDEFRLSNVSRSTDWAKLEYYSMKKTNYNGDNGAGISKFVTHGTETTGNISATTLIESPSSLTFSNVTATSIDVTAQGTFTNLTTGSSGIYFDESVTATNSGWQTTTTWSKSGLNPNTQYSFTAKTRNQASVENTFGGPTTKYTLANTPGTPTVNASWSSTNGYYADITVNPNSNPAGTSYAVTPDEGTNWLQADGSLNPTVYWQTSTTFTHQNLSANTTYSYKVKAKNGESVETALNVTSGSDTTPPAQVTGLLHTSNATTTIAWDWADVMGATSYKVFAGTHSDLETTQVSGCGDVTASNCTQSGLSANTQYTVHIHAANANGSGANSATSSAYTSIEAPGGITFGTVGLNSIQVSASGTFSNLTAGVSGILLTNTTQGTNSGWTQTNSWTSTLLNPNTQYGFKAQARNAEGDLTEETSVSNKYTLAVAPNASADKSTSTWYNTSTFTFTNNASFGAGGVQYYRYVWDQSATHSFSDTETQWTTGTLALNATSNGSWYLHLKSFNGEDTANSTTLDLGPYYFDGSGPGITDNQAGDNTYRNSSGTTYDIDFSDTGGSNLNNIQYQVYAGASQTGTLLKDWTNIITSINASSYTTDFGIDFSSLQEGTNYVTLRAYDNAGSSQNLVDAFYVKKDTVSPSSSSAVVNDGTGTDLTWVTSLTTLSSNWSGFSDLNSGLSSYEYSIGTASEGTNTLGWTSNGSSTSFTNSSLILSEGATYYISVRAKDQANNTSSVKSSNGARVDTLAPATSLTVSLSSPDGSNGWYKSLPTLSLSSTDATSGVAQTYYQWEITSGVWTNYSSSFPGLEGEHSLYYYSLDQASNNESYKSSSLKVDTSSPGAPSSLTAQASSTSQINLSWEESTDPTSGIDKYKVYRSLDNQNFTEIASSSSSSYSDTGLKASTTYFYKVSSVDKASNESSSSNTASATTKSPPSKSPSPTNPPSDDEEETETSPAPTKAKPEETLKVKEVVIKVGEKNLSLTPNEKNEVKVLEGIVKKVTIKVPIADALSATAVINGKEYVLTKEGDYFVGEVKVPSSAGSYEVVITYVTSKGEEKQAKSITLLVDPFGFVYDKDTKARIGNAKVGLFKYDAKAKAYSLWEAKSYGQENPQETNKNGKYGFMVPKGKYYLLVKAPLYESYKSKVLEVEAEPLTLNIGLELENQVIPQEKATSLPPYLILIFVFGLALAIGGATYLFRRPQNL